MSEGQAVEARAPQAAAAAEAGAKATKAILALDLGSLGQAALTGRQNGAALRERWKLDELDGSALGARLICPQGVVVSASFLMGLLAPSIQRAGSARIFWERFELDAPEIVRQTIETCFPRALEGDFTTSQLAALAAAHAQAAIELSEGWFFAAQRPLREGLSIAFGGSGATRAENGGARLNGSAAEALDSEGVLAQKQTPAPAAALEAASEPPAADERPVLNFAELGKVAFVGREEGLALRARWGLDALDAQGQGARFAFPGEAFAISTSFALGLLEESMRAAGSRVVFFERWSFEGSRPFRDTVDTAFARVHATEALVARPQGEAGKAKPPRGLSALAGKVRDALSGPDGGR